MKWRASYLALVLTILIQQSACAREKASTLPDISHYAFTLQTQIPPENIHLKPDVSSGLGSGILRGAAMGAGACIIAGVRDPVPEIARAPAAVVGTVASPVCGAVGGIAGGFMIGLSQKTKKNYRLVMQATSDIGNAPSITTLINNGVLDSGVINDRSFVPDTRLQIQLKSDDAVNPDEGSANLASATQIPEVGSSGAPKASILVYIQDIGFRGYGVDSILRFQMETKVCVVDDQTGKILISEHHGYETEPMDLQTWADLGEAGIKEEIRSLASQVSDDVLFDMKIHADLEKNKDCLDRYGRELLPSNS